MAYFKTVEVRIDLEQGITSAIDAVADGMPSGSNLIGSCATPSSIYLFFNVPGKRPAPAPTPAPAPAAPASPTTTTPTT